MLLFLFLLFATPASASSFLVGIEQQTTQTGQEVITPDCDVITHYDTITVTTTGTATPYPVSPVVDGPTWQGGQGGHFVQCPEDCDDTLVLGSPATTRIEDVMQVTYETEVAHHPFTIERNTCEDGGCDHGGTTTPEPGTLLLVMSGVVGMIRRGK